MDDRTLEEQLDFLLDSLRDLEREHAAGDLSDADHEMLRNDYIARTAELSRMLRDRRTARNSRPVVTPEDEDSGWEPDEADWDPDNDPVVARARRPWSRRILAALVVLGLATGSGFWVAASSGQRLPGQSASGGSQQSTSSMLSTARQLNFSNPTKAIELYNSVLKLEPDNTEALTYRAWLIALTARTATGSLRDAAYAAVLADLMRARTADPTYPDAACFLGIVYFRFLGDAKNAKPELDTCQANNPPQEVQMFLKSIVDEVNKAVGA